MVPCLLFGADSKGQVIRHSKSAMDRGQHLEKAQRLRVGDYHPEAETMWNEFCYESDLTTKETESQKEFSPGH